MPPEVASRGTATLTLPTEAALPRGQCHDLEQQFSQVVAGAAVVLVVLLSLRGPTGSKWFDRAMYGTVVLFAVSATAFYARGGALRNRWFNLVAALLALLAVGGGIGVVEHVSLTPILWEGFGVGVLLLALALCTVFWRVFEWRSLPRIVQAILGAAVGLVMLVDLPGLLWQSGTASPVINDTSRYLLNELLAPSAGNAPDGRFIPQYDTLYGWILRPFASILGLGGLVRASIVLLAVFTVGALATAVWMTHLILGRRSLALAAVLVVPITVVTSFHGTTSTSSLADFLEALPVRIFPSLLLIHLVTEEIVRVLSGRARRLAWALIGLLAGLVAWNCQDFGIVSVGLCSLAILVCLRVAASRRSAETSALVGLLAGIASYPLLLLAIGEPINLAYIVFFQRVFGSGFAASLIQMPGPVLLVLPVIAALAVVGWALLLRPEPSSKPFDGQMMRATLATALCGSWALAGFVYYLNRSYASLQLQILLLPMAIALVGLFALLERPRRAGRARLVAELRLIPLALCGGLLLASLLQTPNPVPAVRQLVTTDPISEYTALNFVPTADFPVMKRLAKAEHRSLGYFGAMGNYVELQSGVESYSLFNYPIPDLNEDYLTASTACAYLEAQGPHWLVTSTDIGPTTFPSICQLYVPAKEPGILDGTVYVRARSEKQNGVHGN